MGLLAIVCALISAQSIARHSARWYRDIGYSCFGTYVGAQGDLDGDGIEELVLGDPGRCCNVDERPSFWIVSPRSRSVLCRIDLPVSAPASYVIDGSADFDGDDTPDLLIARGSYEVQQPVTLFLVAGADGGIVRSIALPGAAPRCGRWACVVPDVDGDLRPDLAAASLAASGETSLVFVSSHSGRLVREIPLTSQPDRGAMALATWRAGSVTGLAVSSTCRLGGGATLDVFDCASGRRRWSHTITRANGDCCAICAVGDVDGDGCAELGIGTGTCAVVLSGSSGRVLRTHERRRHDDSGTRYGQALAAPGDLDGDGTPDLVVGEPEDHLTGVVHAFSGQDGHRIWIADDSDPDDVCRFGRALAVVGDVNADGRREILVGTWQSPTGSPGRAMLLDGASGRVLFEVRRREHDLVFAERFPSVR